MSRGDRREAIFLDKVDRLEFLRTLGRACQKTGWQVHAYCLMSNHFHLVVETPQANLAVGMKWLLGTYTQHFNRRHRHWGHLFGGRYKAQLIDERSPSYLLRACNYVHLNPVRAGIVKREEKLESFAWSSYPAYLRPKIGTAWLRVDRLLGEHGLQNDTAVTRRAFARQMIRTMREMSSETLDDLRRGWKVGAEDFCDRLADKLARQGKDGERAKERNETDAALAEAMVQKALAAVRWREIDLACQPKGHAVKARIARKLRSETSMSRQWIAHRLKIGSPSYVSLLTVDC
jgi:REP element-mobilizing transposase RayT/DNA-binding transcriptional regulator YiaG